MPRQIGVGLVRRARATASQASSRSEETQYKKVRPTVRLPTASRFAVNATCDRRCHDSMDHLKPLLRWLKTMSSKDHSGRVRFVRAWARGGRASGAEGASDGTCNAMGGGAGRTILTTRSMLIAP